MHLDLTHIRAITFDCYGTLIDWDTGIRDYVAPLLTRAARAGRKVAPREWVARWEAIQFEMLGVYRPYAEILTESFERTMRVLELESFADGGPGLTRSLLEWPPFADTVPALRRMARRRRLGIISNVDRVLLADTLGRLQCPLSMVVTAEEARAYKPNPAPFAMALERLGLPPDRVLHAAFGEKYDLGPARALGLRTCFVDRGEGARKLPDTADLTVGSLTELAELLEPPPATG